ncbi:MAG: 50S ribosomal protein L25/general stress protein Ctc [Actinomycetaceae bacterium]|nr:50S ribosomal protein L25/general stress protein Ctc [Actinomycetaceae bacterium]
MANLIAQVRDSLGKGSSRQLRRAGRTPAVIYGLKEEAQHLSFDTHELFLAIKGQANAVLTIEVEGKPVFALVKDVQRHPLKRTLTHVDLLRVTRDEKVEVEVPVVVEGESFSGTLHAVEYMNLSVKAPVVDIPEVIAVNIDGRKEGEHVTVADVKFPADVECDLAPETIVVSISATASAASAEGEEASAEGEEVAE